MTTLRQALEESYQKHGELTADTFLEDCTAKNHPMHDRFDWNQKSAAHQFRLVQAARMIRSVKIQILTEAGEPEKVRAWLAVRQPEAGRAVFAPSSEVMVDPVISKIVLRQMRRDWANFKARYGRYIEFAELLKADLDGDDGENGDAQAS